MDYVTLSNGVKVPQLGFGVFQIPPQNTKKAVDDAISAGYRHFDTAQAYYNESDVGQAIADSGISLPLKYGIHITAMKMLKKHVRNHWKNCRQITLTYI